MPPFALEAGRPERAGLPSVFMRLILKGKYGRFSPHGSFDRRELQIDIPKRRIFLFFFLQKNLVGVIGVKRAMRGRKSDIVVCPELSSEIMMKQISLFVDTKDIGNIFSLQMKILSVFDNHILFLDFLILKTPFRRPFYDPSRKGE